MPNQCQHCGKQYHVPKKKEKTSKFCSLDCAYANRISQRQIRNCLMCGKEFRCLPTSKQTFCNRKCSSAYYAKTYRHSEETRHKMSEAKRGCVPWNKGLTSDNDSRIISGNCKPTCTKMSNPDWAEKIKKATKGKVNLGDKNGMKNPEARKKASISRKKLMENPAVRQHLAETSRKAWADGKFNGVRVGQCKWYSYQKRDGTVVKVQGTWELAFAKWADERGLNYKCHRGRLPYIDEHGLERSYYPDFYVSEWSCWVDVKNDYHYNLQLEKFRHISVCNPQEKVLILRKQDLLDLGVNLFD